MSLRFPFFPRRSVSVVGKSAVLAVGIASATVGVMVVQQPVATAQPPAAGVQPPAARVQPPATGANAVTAEKIEISEAQASLIQNTFVASPLSAQVSEVMVREGDLVTGGEPMIRLQSDLVRSELEAARAAVAAARITAENDVDARYAERTLEVRERELAMSQGANQNFAGAIPSTEIEKLRLVVDQSRLSIEQAQHAQAIANATLEEKMAAARMVETKLDLHTVHAPVSGTVVEVNGEPGEWLENGKPVIRIISTDPIRIECFVDGRRYGKELVDRPVEFRIAGSHPNDSPASGTVTFVSPELNPVTGQVKLWANIDNADGLVRSGMRGSLVIQP